MDHPRIAIDPGIMCGKPCITGTRVPVETLIENLAAGSTVEALAEGYDLDRADVLAALRYAADRLRMPELRAAG